MSTELIWHDPSAQVQNASVEALDEAITQVFNSAQEKVPVKTGELRDSGDTAVDEAALEAAAGYSAEHAIPVHENPEGRGHNWLTNALLENQDTLLNVAAEKLRGVFGG